VKKTKNKPRPNIILAVVGLPGAGKTEAVKYLIKKTNWSRIYFGQKTFDEIKKRKLKINEKNERKIREGLRKKYGMAAMAIINLPEVRKLSKKSNVIIESLYSWEEYLEIKKDFKIFKALAIFASPEVRIKRLRKRKQRAITLAEMESRDYSQIENLHQAGPIARADFTIVNNGSKKDFYKEIDKIVIKLQK